LNIVAAKKYSEKNRITANETPSNVILSVGFSPIVFAVCAPTINCSPPFALIAHLI